MIARISAPVLAAFVLLTAGWAAPAAPTSAPGAGEAAGPPAAARAPALMRAQFDGCSAVRTTCRRRWDGRDYERCVRERGCATRPPSFGGSGGYCRERRQMCHERWGEGTRYLRCVRAGGC